MAYRINGPILQNDQNELNTLLGDSTFSHSGPGGAAPQHGQLYFVDSSLLLRGKSTNTAGMVLITNGPNADPSWVIPSIPTDGFSAAKSPGDIFSNTEIVVANWNTTAPSGVSMNPFFDTGSPNFNMVSGGYTPTTTATYKVDATIQYISTNPTDSTTLIFAEVTIGPVYNAIITMGPVQQRSDSTTLQDVQIHASLKLMAGKTYVLTIQSSGSTGVKTINAKSHASIILVAV